MSALDYLSGLATMIFIAVSLALAAVRWFHMCRPYDRNARYYYPGRPYMTLLFLSSLLLLPCVILPGDGDCAFLLKTYFLPVYILLITVALLSYFGSVMQMKQWVWSLLALGVLVFVVLSVVLVCAILPGDQLYGSTAAVPVGADIYILGVIATVLACLSLLKVREWSRDFDEGDYSNPTDYPVRFAWRMIAMALSCLVFVWVAALADNRVVTAVVQLLLSTGSVLLVVLSLYPNRNRTPQDLERKNRNSLAANDFPVPDIPAIPQERQDEILAAVRKVVEGRRAFLEPHLTLQEVAERCGYDRDEVAAVIRSVSGSFFKYVNSLRLAHVETYRFEHPQATLSASVEHSGYETLQTYYNVKARMEAGAARRGR